MPQQIVNMAASADFINGEEIDDLLMAINEVFWRDERFLEDVDSYVTEIENISDFPCNHCGKSCKSKRADTPYKL